MTTTSRAVRRAGPLASGLLMVLFGSRMALAQKNAKPGKPRPAPALLLAPISGDPIPVLPLTFIVSDTGLAGLPAARTEQLAWADSVIGAALQARGPEATWLLAPELRRVARRAPGMVKDPSQMAQAVMRFENLKSVPDPLLGNIRSLVAMTGSRFVMIPAALRFTRVPGGVQVDAVMVLGDARSGAIPWRSFPIAVGSDAAAAVNLMIARILPDAQ